MKRLSRRGILAGLLIAGGAPVETIAHPPPVKHSFIKGQIMSRIRYHIAPQFPHLVKGPSNAVAVIEYTIFDGEKFVPLDSAAGQRVVAELS